MRTFVGAALAAALTFTQSSPAAAANQTQTNIEAIARSAMRQYHLKAIVVQVRSGGKNVYIRAMGESMGGVPATPAMHFRNGAMAFTYMATLLLVFVDQKKVRLDTRLATFYPNLPDATRITLENLANMTSGYADYVYQSELLQGVTLDPFRRWTSDELVKIGISKPMLFAPGTNWMYSHTNYVILGQVLAKIAGMPLAAAMQKYVLGPMGLTQTRAYDTPQIPEPVLHAFSSERREDLGVPAGKPFYEESTFWSPSWTTAQGAVEITDITDMSVSMEAVGTGKLLSPASHRAQVGPNLVGFGHAQPGCDACHSNETAFNYGLGVVNLGPWITQTKSFSGSGATVGYLPSKKLTISIVTTYTAAAFDKNGNYKNASSAIFDALAKALAPNTPPGSPP